MTTNNRSMHIQFRYGQCLNDGCSKCKSKEIQKIPVRKEFVCQECGKELREVQRPRTWWEKYGKATIAAIVAVVVIGGGATWLSLSGTSNDKPAQQEVAATDSVAAVTATDTASTQTTEQEQTKPVADAESQQATPAQATTATPSQTQTATATATPAQAKPLVSTHQANGANLKCGKYEGPMSGGKPDGVGGNITVTRPYNIDLKDGSGNSVSISAGDRISNTKFKNGVLQQGQLIRSNGERKFLTGLAEHL